MKKGRLERPFLFLVPEDHIYKSNLIPCASGKFAL
jgi:hypothetical protein